MIRLRQTPLSFSPREMFINANISLTVKDQPFLKPHKPAAKRSDADWFDLYDGEGQCLDGREGQLKSIAQSQGDAAKVIDYSKFELQAPEGLDEEEYGHILEIYEFPVEFKNENIFAALKEVIGNLSLRFIFAYMFILVKSPNFKC